MNALLSESLADLRRHAVPAGRYVLFSLVALTVYRWSVYFLDESGLAEASPVMVSAARLALALCLGAASAVIQAVCFAALGAAVARPMWKYKGYQDALNRFFMPWLIINLFLLTLLDLHARLVIAEIYDPAVLLELFLIAIHAAALPLGAAIMFWGALRWQELPEITAPLTRFLSLVLIPVGLGAVQYILAGVRGQFLELSGFWAQVVYSATDLPLIVLDAFIFILVWRICMLDCTTPRDTDDSPLDF